MRVDRRESMVGSEVVAPVDAMVDGTPFLVPAPVEDGERGDEA